MITRIVNYIKGLKEQEKNFLAERERYLMQLKELEQNINSFREMLEKKDAEVKLMLEKLEMSRKEYNDLYEKYSIQNDLPYIDKKLGQLYPVIPYIAYKNKRSFRDKPYTTYLHEFITPEAYEVVKLFGKYKDIKDVYKWCMVAGTEVAKRIKYATDKSLVNSDDYYLLPAEIIANKRGDCEDFSFLMASGNPDNVAVAYGFYELNGQKWGHAFNIFFYADEMFILELTSGSMTIIPYSENCGYYIHYIITKKRCYMVDGSVTFGELAYGE